MSYFSRVTVKLWVLQGHVCVVVVAGSDGVVVVGLRNSGGGGWWRLGWEADGWRGLGEGAARCMRRTLAASLSPAPHTHTHTTPLTTGKPSRQHHLSYFSIVITCVDLPAAVTSRRIE